MPAIGRWQHPLHTSCSYVYLFTDQRRWLKGQFDVPLWHLSILLPVLCDSWCLWASRGHREQLTCQLVVAEDQLSDVRESDWNDRGDIKFTHASHCYQLLLTPLQLVMWSQRSCCVVSVCKKCPMSPMMRISDTFLLHVKLHSNGCSGVYSQQSFLTQSRDVQHVGNASVAHLHLW